MYWVCDKIGECGECGEHGESKKSNDGYGEHDLTKKDLENYYDSTSNQIQISMIYDFYL